MNSDVVLNFGKKNTLPPIESLESEVLFFFSGHDQILVFLAQVLLKIKLRMPWRWRLLDLGFDFFPTYKLISEPVTVSWVLAMDRDS